jgi:hypothetical protein
VPGASWTILGETNIGAAGGALGLAAVSLLTEVSNSDFENWIKALRDARQHETADRRVRAATAQLDYRRKR